MPHSLQAERLRAFLMENLTYLYPQDVEHRCADAHTFELGSQDYLGFAQNHLTAVTPGSMIDCVSHLKRATECAIDTLLMHLGLLGVFKRRKWGVDKKLRFVESIGLFNPRSLAKLNATRNRVEHEYAVPSIVDLELYFELVQAFVYALEGYMYAFTQYCEFWLHPAEEYRERVPFGVWAKYDSEGLKIEFASCYQSDPEHPDTGWRGTGWEIVFDLSDFEDFSFALRIFILLSRYIQAGDSVYIVKQLEASEPRVYDAEMRTAW